MAFVAGVQENVIDVNGDEKTLLTGGRNATYVTRASDPLGNTLITRLVPDQSTIHRTVTCFLAKNPEEHTDVEALIGMACAERSLRRRLAPYQQDVIRHVLLSSLYHDQFPLAGIWGPSASVHRGRTDTRRKALNKIVEELIKCGMTLEEIQQQFINCLKFKSQARPIDFVLKLACAKCFPDDQVHQELSDVLRQHYFERFWRGIVEEPHRHRGDLLPFGYLARAGMVTEHEQEVVRFMLTCLMAEGKTRQAYEIVTGIGELLGLYRTQSHPQFCITRGIMACERDCVNQTLASLVPPAFANAARGSKQFGIAAGLVHTFGAKICAPDEVEQTVMQVVRTAFELNQPVPMELCKYYDLV